MKKITFIIFVALLCSHSFLAFSQTQEDLNTFNKERLKIQKAGMGVLSVWAVGNIATGVVGAGTTDGSVRELYKMNVIWNGINLVLAVPGYIGASKGKYDLPFRKTYKEQTGAEKTFLFNGGLDVAYILGGLYLTEKSKNETDLSKHNRYLGYGNSIIFQGAFLALLDITMYGVHNSHGKRKLDPYLDKIVIGYNGVGFRHTF